MCLAFGVERLDDLGARVADVLELQPPQGLLDKVRGLRKLKSLADSRPKTVGRGPCQEIVLTGDDVDLDLLPIQRCWPDDGGALHHAALRSSPRDPRTGGRNVGMYRMQKVDRRTTRHALADPQGRPRDYLAAARRPARGRRRARARPDHRLLRLGAAAQARRRADDGRLPARRARSRWCSAKTVDLEVPGRRRDRARGLRRARRAAAPEGPFGDHTGYYTRARAVPGLPRHRDDACGATRSTPRSSSASRRRRTPGWARRPSASSCPPSA